MKEWDFSILDQLPDPVIVLDPEDRITFLNAQAIQFGMIFHDSVVTGQHFNEFASPNCKEVVEAVLRQVHTDSTPAVREIDFQDAKGKAYNTEITFSPATDEHDNLSGTVVLIREISNERIFQKKNSQLVHDLSTLIEHANAVIFGLDSQQYVTDWNEECVRVTGMTRSDVLAQHVEEVISAESLELFKGSLADIYARKQVRNFELQLKAQSGNPVVVLLNATPRINSSGVIVGILFVGHDITELHRYQQSLEHMVREKTEKLTHAVEKEKELVGIRNRFVSLASHEFRIPLSNILASANFVREKGGPDPALMEKVENIEAQVGHMRTLIDDLLTIGKADARKLQPTHLAFDLIHFLNEICQEVIINAQQSHTVVFDTTDPAIEIQSDPKLLRNVFINLISNAMKFSPGKQEIYLSVCRNSTHAEVIVKDLGIGIGEEDLVKVFEPFNRGANASDIKGTGLGLSIVKRAVETLGGSISVKSELQKGTEFVVTLTV